MEGRANAQIHAHREKEAIAVCSYNLTWYQRHGLLAMILYRGSQTLAVVLSAATAILILVTELPKWVMALPAAVASLAAGLNGIYLWREDWVRWLATAQALRTELANYQCRHPERYGVGLSPDEALDHFVERVQSLVDAETLQWANLAMQRTSPRRRRTG